MRLIYFISLIPVAFSAVATNPFDLFKEPGIIQHYFLNYLPLHEQIKFMLTCRQNYQFLCRDYNQVVLELTGLAYNDVNDDLKTEIRKLWRFFTLEMQYRNSNRRFSLSDFYGMISGPYFTNDKLRHSIFHDNLCEYRLLYAKKISSEFAQYDRPHFPKLSLILLEAGPSPSQLRGLVLNACKSPHFFDAFFKHLAMKIYKVSRDKLEKRINREYSRRDTTSPLHFYHDNLKNALFFSGLKPFAYSAILSVFIYHVIRRGFQNNLFPKLGLILSIVFTYSAIYFFNRMKSEYFSDSCPVILRNFYNP